VSESLEVERVFLLRGMPDVGAAERWRIEQGYLAGDEGVGGRLRRTTLPDGSVVHHHTQKQGVGLVRIEREAEISCEAFDAHWSATRGRRISKVRHRVPCDGLLWEIDQFSDMPLVLAEVELPSEHHPMRIPSWLEHLVVREVTEDGRYRNFMLAVHGPPDESATR
jgi:CYTH domain-containing protein